MIWSATLTVAADPNGAGTLGCHRWAPSASAECSTALTSTTFTHAGNSYTVGALWADPTSTYKTFDFAMTSNFTTQQIADLSPLVLRVDGHDYRIAASNGGSNGWQWDTDVADTAPAITSFTTKSSFVVQLLEITFGTGTSVTDWEGRLWSKDLGDGTFGCRNGVAGGGCGDASVFSDALFKHPGAGGDNYISYSVQELSFEQLTVYARETDYRIVFTVESDWTVDLKPMTLILSVGGTEHRLTFNSAKRSNHGRTFTWRQSIEPLTHDWGNKITYRTVTARIHAVRTGLSPVRVHYGEVRDGRLLDPESRTLYRTNQTGSNFARWDIARPKPHRDLGQALIAVIPGEFPSIDPSIGKVTTTHVRLFMSGSWPGSTVFYGKGTWNTPPSTFGALRPSDGGSEFIPLDAASKNTYVWVRVQNGDQSATHLVIIDPPPRTFKVNPEVQVTEGDEAAVTVSLGSPATSGGVTFDVTAAYSDGGATTDDVGEVVSQVTVAEGQTRARIVVPTVEDYFVENDESYTVSISHVGSPVWAKDPEGTDTTVVTIVDDEAPVTLPPGPEPHNINITPGDGTLTVTWDVSARDGHDTSEIWHVLRWYQPDGEAHRWHNPRDPRAVGANDGLSVDPGVNSYTISGLTNGVAADVFVRSMVGHRNNMSEQDSNSSRWVKLNGIHTTPIAADSGAPTVAEPLTDFGNLKTGTRRDIPTTELFTDPDDDTLTISAASSDTDVATVTVQHDPSTGAATAIAVTATTPGTATITVTATDPTGNQAADTFTVTVPQPQQQNQRKSPPPPKPPVDPPNNDSGGGGGTPNSGSGGGSGTVPTGSSTPTTDGTQDPDDAQAADGTQDPDDAQAADGTQDADDTQDAEDDNDEVTLEQVQTAVEQYNNGQLGYEELLDLIRKYLTN